jgi:hypothetical protein
MVIEFNPVELTSSPSAIEIETWVAVTFPEMRTDAAPVPVKKNEPTLGSNSKAGFESVRLRV